MTGTHEKFKQIPKIELHVHIDGAVRWTTLVELMKKKNLSLPGDGSVEDFKTACVFQPPGKSLLQFLHKFHHFYSCLIGDLDVIERIAYELCEDQAKNNVMYFEGRFSPHLMSNTHGLAADKALHADDPDAVTPAMTVDSILKGFERGEKEFNIKARLILCCIQGKEDWSDEVVNLCLRFKDRGVVGIDIAGCENPLISSDPDENLAFVEKDVLAFKRAQQLGIHRTVHACEAGPPEVAEAALENLHAERIGHGYHIIEKESTYQMILEKQTHLECCPQSSYCTGAVRMDVQHPIVRFAKDGMNFSLNSDDPTVTGTRITDDLLVAKDLGLTEQDIVKCIFNAAKSSFLPDDEKQELIQKLSETLNKE